MFDDLEVLFHHDVLTAYVEFRDSLRSDTAGLSKDLRLGVNAARALFHFGEHFPVTHRPQRSALLSLCPDFALAGDIINATKHGRLTRGNPQVASATDLEEAIAITEYEDEAGPYRHAEKVVLVRLKDGTTRQVLEILTNVVNMWIDELHRQGLAMAVSNFTLPPHQVPARASANGAAPMNLAARQGVPYTQAYIIQKYDYATGKVVPRDITNDTYEFSVYEPPELDITLTDPKTGRRLRGTVQLTPSERDQVLGLKTDQERRQFLAQISQSRQVKLVEDPDASASTDAETERG
jgi:hypothetical protein